MTNAVVQESSDSKKVWLITGTSSGFGKRLVVAALARGEYVIATARNVEHIQQEFAPSSRLRLLQMDVTEGLESLKLKIEQALSIWGRIDVLVNNAGVGLMGLTEEVGSPYFHSQFATNFYGAIDVTNATLPHMRQRKSGTIVMIGSRSAWRTELLGSGLYVSSKAALHAYSENLAVEVQQFGIRVLKVAPGAFRTEKICSSPWNNGLDIPDWREMRQKASPVFKSIEGKQKGDPAKAVEVIVDVVRDEGRVKGRPWPAYLVLGDDAEADVRKKCTEILASLDQWNDITSHLSFDD